MKFEDLLMQQQQPEEKQTIHLLQQQVQKLEQELDGEIQIGRVLQCAMQGPLGCCDSCSCLSPFLPIKLQMLLAQVTVVEDEINWLERKIHELQLDIYQEKKQFRRRQMNKLSSRHPNLPENKDNAAFSTSQNYQHNTRSRERRPSLTSSSIQLQSIPSLGRYEDESGSSRSSKSRTVHNVQHIESQNINPNKLSEQLIKCLIGIFLKLNQTTSYKSKGTTNLTKNTVNCINSKGLVYRATFSCRQLGHSSSHLDPYEILPEPDVTVRDIGPYKDFIQITTSTLDANHFSECLPDMWRLRVLMQKLSKININCLTHKQKLAFWINVYNTSVMNAFLQHELPSTQERLLALVKEAEINVGGFVLKASTIEHFILRHPAEVKYELTDEKEILLRHACGLGYPEPNVTFALCRGSWSSPALRFYTPDEVMNELERAKVEYLEASVGITNKKKILVPKLMQWHMKDFADDMESLLEWIYSQLPYTSSLKRLMMECLDGETQSPSQKLIEIQQYTTEFRYLIPA